MDRKIITKTIATVAAIAIIFFGIVSYFVCKIFVEPTACKASSIIHDAIKDKLSQAESATLKPIRILTDENESRSLTFAYRRNGNGETIFISGRVDNIHGIKLGHLAGAK